ENLPSLKRLGVYYCRKIINLDFLPSNIEKLTLQNLPNLNEIRGLSVVKMLSFLKIEGCKDIDSIQVLNDLEKLKEVRIITNTKIIDGDMSSLIKIEKVIFRDYKYYTHLNENFKAVENKKRVTT
ncbi:MAG: hypothetical protein U9R19_14140, partial [Bacteroidota bacterium]|nr:hypothetical protein [Bacteroidota bacterium]